MNRLFLLGLCASLCPLANGQSGIITTIVGGNAFTFPTNITSALSAPLGDIPGAAVDSKGNVYLADLSNNLVFQVSPAGVIQIVAGNGTYAFSGDGGPATAASLSLTTNATGAAGVAVDTSGNLFIADTGNGRVRKVSGGIITTVATYGQIGGIAVDIHGNLFVSDILRVHEVSPSGAITTVAGNGFEGFSGDGGPATSASFKYILGVAVDVFGNLFITDWGNSRIRKISTNGIITTVAGNGTQGFSGDGGPATLAKLNFNSFLGGINSGASVAVDTNGNLYIADTGNQRARKVSPNGIISTVAGDGIIGFLGDGGPATLASLFEPQAVGVDSAGNLFIADSGNERIRKVSTNGSINTVAGNGRYGYTGDGGPAAAADINLYEYDFGIAGVALDGSGNLFFADQYNNRVREVSPNGTISTVAGNGDCCFSGDGGPATSAQLNQPVGIAVDSVGDMFIADSLNNRIRKVSVGGAISTIAGNGVAGFSGDGGAGASAQLSNPTGVAVDKLGNLFIIDAGNNRVRQLSANGTITTIAGNGTFNYSGNGAGDGGPATSAALGLSYGGTGIAVDASGDVLFTDFANDRVRMVSPTGIITTIAGGGQLGDGVPATSAALDYPDGIAIDSSGNLFVTEYFSQKIREVSTSGFITTVAGFGITSCCGPFGDGGPAILASLNGPAGIVVDKYGNLIFADIGNNRIREVSPPADSLAVTPTTLNFSLVAGTSSSQPVNLTGGVNISWNAIASANWLTPNPAASTGPGTMNVIASAASLQPGAYGADITVIDSSASPPRSVGVTVNLTVTATAQLSVAPSALAFQAQAGVVRQSALLQIGGTTGVTWQAIVTPVPGAWLSLSAMSGQIPAAPTITIDPTNLQPGTYQGSIAIQASNTTPSSTLTTVFLTVTPLSGVIVTVAGNGAPTFSGDGAPAASGSFDEPFGTGIGSLGNVLIADSQNHRIRMISASGTIVTVAGSGATGLGNGGFSGDGGPAASATLNYPAAVAVDGSGNLYISDSNNNRIRKISSSGVITTVVGSGAYGFGTGSFSGDGGPATSATLFSPAGIAFDQFGNLFVADTRNNRVRKISAAGVITTVTGGGTPASGIGDGGPATAALLSEPYGVAIDGSGNLYIADEGDGVIRRVSPSGIIMTVAGGGAPANGIGDGGPATSASLGGPDAIVLDGSGNLYIADQFDYRVRKLSTSGIITTVAGNGNQSFSGDGGPAIFAAMQGPGGLAVDGSGNLLIADTYNNRIRKVLFTAVSLCDINQDGVLNVADVQLIIKQALGVTPIANDLNGDGAVNIADIQIGINGALSLGCSGN